MALALRGKLPHTYRKIKQQEGHGTPTEDSRGWVSYPRSISNIPHDRLQERERVVVYRLCSIVAGTGKTSFEQESVGYELPVLS